jgi:DNA-binding CsgD family transcriptional regulator
MPFTGRQHLGREAELEHLQRRLEQARAGHGGVVVVRGPSGTGTTRFAHEVAARADRDDMLVLWGRCSEGLMDRPYGGLADALEEYGTGLEPVVLEEQLGPGAPPLARLAPALRSVVPHIAPPAPLDAADDRLRLAEAVVGWLERASAARPLLLVIDDLHWADADLLWLLRRIRRAAERTRLLMVATQSLFHAASAEAPPPTGVDVDIGELATEVIDLPGLDVAAIGALLAQEFAYPLRVAFVEALTEASAGVPLYSRHLLRHLAEERGAGSMSGPDAASRPLPTDFAELLAWRTSLFGPQAVPVLNALACFASGASVPALAAVCRLPRPRTAEAMEDAVAAGLARAVDSGERFVIDHDLIRLTVLAGLTPPRRADLHRRVAETLEAEYGQRSREHAGELAEHYHRSAGVDDDSRGIRYCVVAAEQARAAAAYRRSAQALAMGLDLVPKRDRPARAELLTRVAVAQAEAGLVEEALASASTALGSTSRGAAVGAETVTGVTDCLRVLRSGGAHAAEAHEGELEELRRRTLASAVRAGEHVRLRLEALGERWQQVDSGPWRSLQWSATASEAVVRLLAEGDQVDAGLILSTPRARTRDDTLKALSVARGSRRPPTILHALRAAVLDMTTRHGLFREGAAWAGRYLGTAEKYGSLRDQAAALALMARCQAVLGRLDQASQAVEAATETVGRVEDDPDLRRECLLSELVIAHYRDGDWGVLVERAGTDEPAPQGAALAAEQVLAWARGGREPEALAALPEVIGLAAHQPPLTLYRDAALLAALAAAWELGTAEHAAHGRSLIELARGGGAGTQPTGSLGMAQARMLGLSGDVEGVREVFARERPYLEEAGLAPLRAIADHDEAIALAAGGAAWYAKAAALLARAEDAFEELAMAGWRERAHRLLEQGFEAARAPGGRLDLRYPAGLSRAEAAAVRLVAGGATPDEAASALDLETALVERHLASAVEKLGGEGISDVPRLARRHGLGGGV